MLLRALVIACFIGSSLGLASAQTATPPTAPAPLTETAKLKIRNAQHNYDQLTIRYLNLLTEKARLEQVGTNLFALIQQAQDAAYLEGAVDKKAWMLDPDTLEFKPAPKPSAAVAPAPESQVP